jgi:FtsP/CotA-like multicopper oxidase with cupredoxin domain
MNRYMYRIPGAGALIAVILLLFMTTSATAAIDGITGSSFSFTAKAGTIANPDGSVIPIWGYANGDGAVQYPGPTMIVSQGAPVTVTLVNQLAEPVSIVFPGQKVTAVGRLTRSVPREGPPHGDQPEAHNITANHPRP